MIIDEIPLYQFIFILVFVVGAFSLSIAALVLTVRYSRWVKSMFRALNIRVLKRYVKAAEEIGRLRRRYLVFEVIANRDSATKEEVERRLKEAFKTLFGVFELSRAGIAVKFFDKELQRGVIRFNSSYRAKLLVSIGYAQYASKGSFIVVPIRTTGTLKKAVEYVTKL